MSDWVQFFDFKHSLIYVNARHRDVHYRTVAEDIAKLVPKPTARVLDFGCGEATSADLVAAASGHLVLVEAAPTVRANLTRRFADNPKIEVVASDRLAALPEASFDLVVIHSVAQYLTPAELDGLLATFRGLLAPDGVLVVGDVTPPGLAAPKAALVLLQFGARNGFFWAAAFGLVRIFVSDYVRLKRAQGLSYYDEKTILVKLAAAGFKAERTARNIGHNPFRMTFLCRIP